MDELENVGYGLNEAIDLIDASIFTGNAMHHSGNKARMLEILARWKRGVEAAEDDNAE